MAAREEQGAEAAEPKGRSAEVVAHDQAELDRICLYNLLSTSSDLIYFKDLQSRFLRASCSSAAFTGAGEPTAMIGRTDDDYFTREEAERARASEQRILRSGHAETDLEEHQPALGSPYEWLSTSKHPLRDFGGTIIGTYGISRDITARAAAEQQLKARTAELDRVSRELRTLLDSSPDAMLRFDRDLRCTFANPAALQITGGKLVGHIPRELGYPEGFVREWEHALRRVLDTGHGEELEHHATIAGSRRFLHTRLVPETDEDDRVVSILTVSRDLTDRKRMEEVLAERATHDPLTGLANRALLTERIDRALGRITTESESDRVVVLFLDLDGFKEVNDCLGHAVGDALLVKVAERLQGATRRGDVVARFGGDEFAIACEGVQYQDVVAVTRRVRDSLDAPIDVGGRAVRVSASIGIAVTNGRTTSDALMREADAAMYEAKSAKRGGSQLFDLRHR